MTVMVFVLLSSAVLTGGMCVSGEDVRTAELMQVRNESVHVSIYTFMLLA